MPIFLRHIGIDYSCAETPIGGLLASCIGVPAIN